MGPYIFVWYAGKVHFAAEVAEVGGKLLMVSAANLLPMHQHDAVELPAVDEASSSTLSDLSMQEDPEAPSTGYQNIPPLARP